MEKPAIPHFIIVGTMKSGTSTLAFHLRNHPQIHMPREELHFFDNRHDFERGTDWYVQRLVRDREGNESIIGEKTPTYSYQPDVAAKIHAAFPKVKLVWIFREPTKRSYSNYLHACCSGRENLSFKQAVEQEDQRIKKNIFRGYVKRSVYHEQVTHFLKFFEKEQMHFMLFEHFLKDPERELGDLFRFLGVSEEGFELQHETKNYTVLPRFPKLWYRFNQKKRSSRTVLYQGVKALNFLAKTPGYPKIDAALQTQLRDFFAPHNEKLRAIIDKDLSVWSHG